VHVSGSIAREPLRDVWIIYHPGQGAKSHGVTSEQKYMRDANLLLEDLKLHPDNPRSQFYLAQSYKHAGHYSQALAAYLVRTRMKGWIEETYMAKLEVGRVSILLNAGDDTVTSAMLHAFNFHPTRAEPLYELARYFRLKKQYGKAYAFGKAALGITKPDDRLFVAQDIYDWKILDELGISSYYIKDYDLSYRATTELFIRMTTWVTIPEKDLERIKKNLDFSREKIRR
jgi:tetratricopeptide (TPR) repeat protein